MILSQSECKLQDPSSPLPRGKGSVKGEAEELISHVKPVTPGRGVQGFDHGRTRKGGYVPRRSEAGKFFWSRTSVSPGKRAFYQSANRHCEPSRLVTFN